MENNEQKTNKIEKESDWLQEELGNTNEHEDFDSFPSMKFEEKKVTTITVDFSNPFQKWTGEQGNKTVTKAIIPVMHNNEKKNWWLNTRNPVYREILKLATEGQSTFKILQTGTQANTKYSIIIE